MRWLIALGGIWSGIISTTAAQSFLPFFTIDRSKGCPGMAVNMTYAFEDSAFHPDFKPTWFWRNPFINFFQNISVSGIAEITGNRIIFERSSPTLNGKLEHYAIDVSANKLIGRTTFEYQNKTYRRHPYEIRVFEPKTPLYRVVLGDSYRVKLLFPNDSTRYYDEFEIHIGSDTFWVSSSQTEFTYSRPGTHTVKITGHFAGNNSTGGVCGSSSITLTPYETLPRPSPPSFEWKNHQLILDLNDTELKKWIEYELQIRDLSGNLLANHHIFENPIFPDKITVNLPSFTPLQISIQPIDCCGSNTDDRRSESVYYLPISVKNDFSTGNLQIDWQAYPTPTLKNFELFKNQSILKSGIFQQWIDSSVLCNQEYCYQLRAKVTLSNGKNRTLIMNQACAYAIYKDSLDFPSYFFASVDASNTVQIKWDLPRKQIAKATLLRTTSEELISQKISPQTLQQHIDTETEPSNYAYCYELHLEDSCGNFLKKGTKTCTILLTVQKNKEGLNVLSWTPFIGFGDTVKYILEVLDKDSKIIRRTILDTLLSYTEPDRSLAPLSEYFYRICVLPSLSRNSLVAYSNIVRISELLDIKIPTAFSPNSDRLNDTFKPMIKNYRSYEMQIFNRWGTLIYQANEQDDGWDGTIGNEPAPVGAYIYQIIIIDLNGNKIQKNGMFALIR
ncbi:MAG: gliding motility-associated C-terminal domain-containing protein [Cytophagales bacterium]|nr:gliding motility-associated C-terminal domain-containing protein [Cytophagales bacterium]MDW8385310.1 gliding motility-associated C-terminal domain-containing protein [Flammeovirgaceae bacterium]